MKKVLCVVSLLCASQQMYCMAYVTTAAAKAADLIASMRNEGAIGSIAIPGTYAHKKAGEAELGRRLPNPADAAEMQIYRAKFEEAVGSIYTDYLGIEKPTGLNTTRKPIDKEHAGLFPHRLFEPRDPMMRLYTHRDSHGIPLNAGELQLTLNALKRIHLQEEIAGLNLLIGLTEKRIARLRMMNDIATQLELRDVPEIPENQSSILMPLLPDAIKSRIAAGASDE